MIKIFSLLFAVLFFACGPGSVPVKEPISECKAELGIDQDSLKDELSKLPIVSVDTSLTMRVQMNFIHFDSSYFEKITDQKILKLQEQIDADFPDFTIKANDNVEFYVYPEEFFMEDIEGDESGLNELAVLDGKFTEGALNINFVPSMGRTRGYTLPFFYPAPNGQIAWVDYEVFENPRGLDGWVGTAQHEIGHALSLPHVIDSTGFPCIQHGYCDNFMGYAKMKDNFTMDQRERMYLFLFYERQDWHW